MECHIGKLLLKTSHKTDSNSAIMGNYVCIVVGVVNQLR